MHCSIFLQIVSELLLPKEVIQTFAGLLVEGINDVSVVHLDCDKGYDNLTDDCGDLASDN